MYKSNNMTEQEKKEYDEAMKEYFEALEKDRLKTNKLISEVESIISEEQFKYLKEYTYNLGDTFSFEITDQKPQFKKDTETILGLNLWVDQYINGGVTGDSFEGTVYVELETNKYLKFDYEM